MPTLYQNISIGLVIAGMAVVYGFGGSGVTSLAAVVLILVRALSYSQQLQTNYHSLAESAPVPRGARPAAEGLRRVGRAGPATARSAASRRLTFEDVWFEYVPGVPVLKGISLRRRSRARRSASWGRRAAASPPSCSCCCGCARRPPGGCWSTASPSTRSPSTRGTGASPSCPRSRGCSRARSPTTSGSSDPTSTRRPSSGRPSWPTCTTT